MTTPRRPWGEGSIYQDTTSGRWVGAISVSKGGKRKRRKVTGRTRGEVRAKLAQLRKQLDAGIDTPAGYTVTKCVNDFLENCLTDNAPETKRGYGAVSRLIAAEIGQIKLGKLTAMEVEQMLKTFAKNYSTSTVKLAHAILRRAIRYAEARDMASRNVAEKVNSPKGQPSKRPNKAMSLDQSVALLRAAKGTDMEAYIAISLLAGVRTEEARKLTWPDVDLDSDSPTVSVYRSVRVGGDTKTPKSRRRLKLPQLAVDALREHRERQEETQRHNGEVWQDHGLVFTRADGGALSSQHVGWRFSAICTDAGLDPAEWSPRMLRHTFTSILSNYGDVAIEEISRLLGHSTTSVTESVYRQELRPALTAGAESMDRIFGQ